MDREEIEGIAIIIVTILCLAGIAYFMQLSLTPWTREAENELAIVVRGHSSIHERVDNRWYQRLAALVAVHSGYRHCDQHSDCIAGARMTMSNVIKWPGITKLPIPPDDILERSKGKYGRVLVLGVDDDGKLSILSSEPDLVVCNYDLDRAKHWIMKEVADEE
jgi:hypothetical protein